MNSITSQSDARTCSDPQFTSMSETSKLIKSYPPSLNGTKASGLLALSEEPDILRELLFDNEICIPRQLKPLIKLQSCIGTSSLSSMAHHISLEMGHSFQYSDGMQKLRTSSFSNPIIASYPYIGEGEKIKQNPNSALFDESNCAYNDQRLVLSAVSSVASEANNKHQNSCANGKELHPRHTSSLTDPTLTKLLSLYGSNRTPSSRSDAVSELPFFDSESVCTEYPGMMTALVSPPKVFIQEFCRHPSSFFQDMNEPYFDRPISSFEDARVDSTLFSSVNSVYGTAMNDDDLNVPHSTYMLDLTTDRIIQEQNTDNAILQSEPQRKFVRLDETPERYHTLASTNGSLQEKKLHVYCSYTGCTNLRRSGGFCNRHCGKCCEFSGCHRVALSRGKCPDHGGGSRCKKDGCYKFAQTRGLCKSHGGGRQCNVPGCSKNAHQNRLCRSHGGGKRCNFVNCSKWAQRSGFCCAHTKCFK